MKRSLLPFVVMVTGWLGSPMNASADSDRDVAAGARIYTQCTGCHAPAYHRTGPKHCGLMGRRAGSSAGFAFTPALRDSGIVWTKETLDQFLRAPLAMIPRTSMGYAGLTSPWERRQLIAFLNTLTAANALCR